MNKDRGGDIYYATASAFLVFQTFKDFCYNLNASKFQNIQNLLDKSKNLKKKK